MASFAIGCFKCSQLKYIKYILYSLSLCEIKQTCKDLCIGQKRILFAPFPDLDGERGSIFGLAFLSHCCLFRTYLG